MTVDRIADLHTEIRQLVGPFGCQHCDPDYVYLSEPELAQIVALVANRIADDIEELIENHRYATLEDAARLARSYSGTTER